MRRHRLQHLGGVSRAVVAVGAGVRKHPWRAGAGDRDRARLLAQQLAGRRLLRRHLQADGHLPASAGVLRRIDEEALLLQRHRRLAVRARQRDAQQRNAGLVDETRKDALDRLARGGRERFREIFRGRVLVGVRLEVGVDALAERLGPDVALQHAQYRRALLVGDTVERLVDLGRRLDVGMHRARRLQ